jgi:hypothetical protein
MADIPEHSCQTPECKQRQAKDKCSRTNFIIQAPEKKDFTTQNFLSQVEQKV